MTAANAGSFSLSSTTFSSGSDIPAANSCDGKDVSPQLSWSGVPDKTQSLALILSDPDAPGGTFYHWVLFNIPDTMTSLPAGLTTPPSGVKAGKNSWGRNRYNGPCPPKGSTHRYIFTLYALDSTLNLATGTDADSLMDAMKNHILGQTELEGKFGH